MESLNCKSLMVGDWVYNTHNQKPEQVCEILERMVMLDYNDMYEYDEIEPIPLTPEILEKNGFIHYTDFYMWKEESLEPIHLDNYDEDGWRLRINCDNIPCECKYVHQLQHALRLCGIKKEIVL